MNLKLPHKPLQVVKDVPYLRETLSGDHIFKYIDPKANYFDNLKTFVSQLTNCLLISVKADRLATFVTKEFVTVHEQRLSQDGNFFKICKSICIVSSRQIVN